MPLARTERVQPQDLAAVDGRPEHDRAAVRSYTRPRTGVVRRADPEPDEGPGRHRIARHVAPRGNTSRECNRGCAGENPSRTRRPRTRPRRVGARRGAVTRKDPHQGVFEIAGRAEPLATIDGGCTLDNLDDSIGKLGADIAQAHAFAAGMAAADFGDILSVYREVARQEIEQQHAEAVDVSAEGSATPFKELRCDVRGRARELRRGVRVRCPHAAEVHQHDAPAHLPHHVLGLDVAVDKVGTMERGERPAQIDADSGNLARAHRTTLADDGPERLAFDELHPDPDLLIHSLGAVHRQRRLDGGCGQDGAPLRAGDSSGTCRSTFSATSRSSCASQAR